MIGILLAGGEGTRLKPYTIHFNKHFYPIFDKPMVYYSLKQFELMRIKKLIIVCKKKDQLKFKQIAEFYFNFIKISFIEQRLPLGAMHAISLCRESVGSNEVLINMGDHFLFDFKNNNLIFQSLKKYRNVIFCIKSKEFKEFGNLKFNRKGTLQTIVEKPKKKFSDFILTGLFKLSKGEIPKTKDLKVSKRNEYEVAYFINQNNFKFKCIKLPSSYLWCDMGSFDRISKLSKKVKNGI